MVDDGVGLLKLMLEKDPRKRISASGALNHEFFKPMELSSGPIEMQHPIISLNNIP